MGNVRVEMDSDLFLNWAQRLLKFSKIVKSEIASLNFKKNQAQIHTQRTNHNLLKCQIWDQRFFQKRPNQPTLVYICVLWFSENRRVRVRYMDPWPAVFNNQRMSSRTHPELLVLFQLDFMKTHQNTDLASFWFSIAQNERSFYSPFFQIPKTRGYLVMTISKNPTIRGLF